MHTHSIYMINIFIFFTQTFNTHTTHVLFIFPFPYFYAEFSKRTFIERYQIIPVSMFTIIYAYCSLLTIDLTLKLMKFYLFIIYNSTLC